MKKYFNFFCIIIFVFFLGISNVSARKINVYFFHGDGCPHCAALEKYLNEEGTLRLDEMGVLAYDPYGHGYYEVGKKVGNAFKEGQKLK